MSVSALAQLRGATARQVAGLAGLRLSVAQSCALKAVAGELLLREELREFRRLTSTTFAGPAKAGYRRAAIVAGRQSGKTLHVAAPIVVSALLSDVDARLAPGQKARAILLAPTLLHLTQLADGVAGILERLGLEFRRTEREIEVDGTRVVAQLTVADHLGPRSGSAVLAVVDEACLLPTEEGADGRDLDVVASVLPSLRVLGGRLVMISSPWGQQGFVHDVVKKHHGHPGGEWLVMRGPTWQWNPTQTEEACRRESPDDRFFRREYAGEFGENDDAFLRASDVRACVEHGVRERPAIQGTSYVIGLDVGFRRDRTGIVVLHREYRKRDGAPPIDRVVVDCVRQWVPTPGEPLSFDQVMRESSAISDRYNGAKIYRDAFAGDAVAWSLKQRGTRTVEVAMTAQAQAVRFELLAQRIRTGMLALPDHEALVRELIDLRVRLHQAGRVEIAAPAKKGAHDDLADALAVAVEAAAQLSPSGDIRREVHARYDEAGVHVREDWFTVNRDGSRSPSLPPRGTAAWKRAQAERNARGVFVPEDFEEAAAVGRSINIPVR